MQILLVAGSKIVLFTSKHTVTNFMSVAVEYINRLVHRLSADKRLLLPTLVSRIDCCELSRYRFRLNHLLVTRPED